MFQVLELVSGFLSDKVNLIFMVFYLLSLSFSFLSKRDLNRPCIDLLTNRMKKTMDSVIESEEGLKVDSSNREEAETSNSKSHEENDKEVKTESDLKEEKKKTEKNKDEDEKIKTVPFHKLFAFADSFDILLMILGTIGAVGNGLGFPIMTILFGDVIDVFGQNQNTSDVSDKIAKVINRFCSFTYLCCFLDPQGQNDLSLVQFYSQVALKFVYLGLGTLVAALLRKHTLFEFVSDILNVKELIFMGVNVYNQRFLVG